MTKEELRKKLDELMNHAGKRAITQIYFDFVNGLDESECDEEDQALLGIAPFVLQANDIVIEEIITSIVEEFGEDEDGASHETQKELKS